MQANRSRFSEAAGHAFEAFRADPALRRTARVGPCVVEFGFSSAALGRAYTQSLLPVSSAAADLHIRVLTPEDVDLTSLVPSPREQGRAFASENYFSLWHPDARSVLYLFDRARNRALVWLPDGTAPDWELSRPACPLIHTFFAATPWAMIHGAAVGRSGRVLLLTGKGRAGKTTAALSCALAGWDYAGDDYVLADTAGGAIAPVYTSARLRADMAGSFADIVDARSGISFDDDDPRHELRLADHLPSSRIQGGRMAAILLPRRQGAQKPTFKTAPRAEALNALFRISMLAAPGPLRPTAIKLTRLVSLAPVFFVDTGTDPHQIPDAFAHLLDRV